MALLARAGMGLLRGGGRAIKYGTLGAVALSGATPAVAAAAKVGGAFSSVGKGVGRGVGRMFGSQRGGGGSGGGGSPKVGGPSRGDSGLLAVGLLFQIHQEVAAIKGLMLQQAPESEERERQFEEAQRHKELIAALSSLGGGGSGMPQRNWQDWLKSVLGGLLALSGLALLPGLLKNIPSFTEGIQAIFDKLSIIFDDMLAFFVGLKLATKKVNIRQQKATVKAQNKAAKKANRAVKTGKNTIVDERARLAAEEKERKLRQSLADEKTRAARALKLEREAAKTREEKLKTRLKEQKDKAAKERKAAAQRLKDAKTTAANALKLEKSQAAAAAKTIADNAKTERAEAKKLATERAKIARADRLANTGLIDKNARQIVSNTAAINKNTDAHKKNADRIVRQGAPKTSGQGHPSMRPAVTGAQTAYERGWSRIWGDREGRMPDRHPAKVSPKAPAVTTKSFGAPTNILQQNVRSVSLLNSAEKATLARQGYAIAKDNVLYDKKTGRMTPARDAAQVLRQLEFNRVARVVTGATGGGGFAGETGRAPVTGTGKAPPFRVLPSPDAKVGPKDPAGRVKPAVAPPAVVPTKGPWERVKEANEKRKQLKLKVAGFGGRFEYHVGKGWVRGGAAIATAALVVKYVFEEVSMHYMRDYIPAMQKAGKKNGGVPDPRDPAVVAARRKLQEVFNTALIIISIGISGAVVGAALGGFAAGLFAAFVTLVTGGIGAGFAPILVFIGALGGGAVGYGWGMQSGESAVAAMQSMGLDLSLGMAGENLAEKLSNKTVRGWMEYVYHSVINSENQALMEAAAGGANLDEGKFVKGDQSQVGLHGLGTWIAQGEMVPKKHRNVNGLQFFWGTKENPRWHRWVKAYNKKHKTNITPEALALKLFGKTSTWTKRNRFMGEWHPDPKMQALIGPHMITGQKMSLEALRDMYIGTPLSADYGKYMQDVWAAPESQKNVEDKRSLFTKFEHGLGDAIYAMFGKTTDVERSLEADAAARKNASAFLKSDRKHSLAGRLIKKIRNTEEQLKTKTEGRHKERLTRDIDDMYNRLHRMVGGVGDVNKTVIIPYTQAIIDSSTTSNNLDSTITKVKSDGAVVIPAAGTGVVPIGRYP